MLIKSIVRRTLGIKRHVVKRVEQHDTELRIELDAWKRRWLPCPTGFWVYSFRGDRLFPEIRP